MALEITPPAPRERPLDWLNSKAPTDKCSQPPDVKEIPAPMAAPAEPLHDLELARSLQAEEEAAA
eukprot:10086961-Alexandrium_andersonii.AAC.1